MHLLNPVFICTLVVAIIIIKAANHRTIERVSSSRLCRHRSLQLSSSFSTAITKLTASNGGMDHHFGEVQQLYISNNRIIISA
jgi:hypothetical protein